MRVVALFVCVLSATATAQDTVAQPQERSAAGLLFRADVRLIAERATMPVPPGTRMPQAIRVVVRVRNPSNTRIETTVRGCTVLLRSYRVGDRAGTLAWDQGRGIECMQDPLRLALDAGESRRFDQQIDASWIVGDSLPPGRYAFTAVFRLADETLEIPAGELELPNQLESLTYKVDTRLVDTVLYATARVSNAGTRAVYLEYGDCVLSLRAYRTPDRTSPPVWRSEARATWDGAQSYACLSYLAVTTLAPGATANPLERELRIPVIEVLGDSLPNGRYYFSGTLNLNSARTPEVPAGSAELALPRSTLPSSRTVEAARYGAATSLETSTTGPTVRTTVTVTLPWPAGVPANQDPGGAVIEYSADCPVVLYVYRDRTRRDAMPRSGQPDWQSRLNCGSERQKLVKRYGESWTFDVRAAAREILGDRLPSGRYYFAALVRADRRLVYLSAGEANLKR
jgi:hypothetical protein